MQHLHCARWRPALRAGARALVAMLSTVALGSASEHPPTGPAPAASAATTPAPAQGAVPAVPPAPPSSSPGSASPAAAAPLLVEAPFNGKQLIAFLDQTIDWYRTLGMQEQIAREASDFLILSANRQTANQVVQHAFDAARATAELVSPKNKTTDNASTQALAQRRAQLDAQASALESELATERKHLASSKRKARATEQAKVDALAGELELIGTKRSLLDTLSSFEHQKDDGSSLRAQIDAMAVALPAVTPSAPGTGSSGASHPGTAATSSGAAATPASVNPGAASSSASANAAPSGSGLLDLTANLYRLAEKRRSLDDVSQRTVALQTQVTEASDRVVAALRTLSARGDALVTNTAQSGSAPPVADVHASFDAIAAAFKQLSAILLPLSQMNLLLGQYRHDLDNWKGAVESQTHDTLRVLGVRLALLLLALGMVFALAEAWRRAVLHYVQEPRRRYQLMLLRRIAVWILIAIIAAFAFASELSSFATFAGLITAGIAVAMQSVLVSIVGYFFLIGRYGLRVGDRVQIGEVRGEVIDIGLVRLQLMELVNSVPTGRVVAFANSVVFQVATGLFKQIPGVNVAWHELTLALPPHADAEALKEKLTVAAVNALADYREDIERQTREITRTSASSLDVQALPTVQLKFSPGAVEALVRYPVHLQHAAEVDERMSRALLQVIAGS